MPDLSFAFDVGHSSIGWAVLHTPDQRPPELLGCGSVIFPADDCLAAQRRTYRRQRRHIRATRQRIARLKTLLLHRGVLTRAQLDAVTSASPWQLAARVLAGGEKLTWPELWDVLRWYAHNRGYDGNRAWSRTEADAAAEKEDTEKVQKAMKLMETHGTTSMAATWCAVCGLDPLGEKTACALPGDRRPKALKAAFPREIVLREVRSILARHVDDALIRALLDDWRAVACPGLRLPARYRGGLLFGQLVPRFDNRIIATCPITFEQVYQRVLAATGEAEKATHEAHKLAKVPAADCREYFRYRWAMQVANVLVQTGGADGPRRLSVQERQALDARMAVRGALTKSEFAQAVEAITGGAPSNVRQMLLHPDADKALVVDRVQQALTSKGLAPYLAVLPARLQKRLRGRLRRGAVLTLGALRDELAALGDPAPFDAVLARELDGAETRRRKKTQPATRADLLARSVKIEPLSGRAPHSRAVMQAVSDFVFTTDRHPAEEGGPLYRSEAIRAAQLARAIDQQTNNHLVRHRLKLLERLHADLLQTYAGGQKERLKNLTLEVNRAVRELSGKTAKQVAQELGLRLSNFKSVAAKLEKDLAGTGLRLTPGLLRKARIAEDLGWRCPYTGAPYDALTLARKGVDKDHIIPRSERPSDSLASLVITFPEVNRMKGKRTALRFLEDCAGQTVEGAPHLSLKTLAQYHADVEKLETHKGHADDQHRKKARQRLLLLRDYVEKEFTPGDLTRTSQLVRLGAQALERAYAALPARPVITSLPGFLTGTVRKSWDLLGCLATACPAVLDPDTGHVRTKTEIRDLTHLHHALDACVLACARHFLPRDGAALELLAKRRLSDEEKTRARAFFRDAVELTAEGQLRLADLPTFLKEQIRTRLAERRVVQHLPRDLAGMRAELNAWRVLGVADGRATLRQTMRQPDGTRKTKEKTERVDKLVGLRPGKLQRLKAALIIGENYGLALDPEPTILPHHHVWRRLGALKAQNHGQPIRLLRNGMLIRVPHQAGRGDFRGTWRILSTKSTEAFGLCFDLAPPDGTTLAKGNVQLATLLKCGLEILAPPLCGVAAPPGPPAPASA
jgi:CRISPR-associated endonuclease Csn1